MLDFAVVLASPERRFCPQKALAAGALVRPFPSDLETVRTFGDTHLLIWQTAVAPFSRVSDVLRQGSDGTIDLYLGHSVDGNGRTIFNVTDYVRANEVTGNYVALRIGPDGRGECRRSSVSSMPLYYGTHKGFAVLGTSVFLVANLLGLDRQLDEIFARWVLTYSVAGTSASVIEGITAVGIHDRVSFDGRLRVVPGDIAQLYRSELADLYRRDRKAYWDVCYDSIRTLCNVCSLTEQDIRFPLSGGKDSRLLLALMLRSTAADRITEVYTNGPPISPEVISAKLVCEHLGLRHSHRDTTHDAPVKPKPIVPRLLLHLNISECEMSPMDLTFDVNPRPRTVLAGQEGGLRNIAGPNLFENRDALYSWFRRHLGGGDMCQFLRPDASQRTMSEAEAFIDAAVSAGIDYSEVPSLHRVHFRMTRWVNRTWKALNSIGFAPFLFVNDVVIAHTLSAGAQSRIAEEFHYEMLRRCDRSLVHIPFAEQSWSPTLAVAVPDAPTPAEPLRWPDGYKIARTRASWYVLQENRDAALQYSIAAQSPVLERLVDWGRAEVLFASELKSGHFAPVWQLIQLALTDRLFRADASGQSQIDLPQFVET